MRKLLACLIIITCLGLILTACSTQPADTVKPAAPSASVPKTTSPSLTPQPGGVLKLLWQQTPQVFGYPAEISGISVLAGEPALEGLLDFDDLGHFKPNALATSFEIAKDGKTATIGLRKGVKFHDGTDFNAAAAKWNLDQVMQGKVLGTESWTSIDKIDDFTIRINLKYYDSTFATLIARTTGLQISPSAVQKNGAEWAKYHPVGTGPFQFKSFERDVSVKYERFDGYWNGKPYLDGIEIYFTKNTTVQTASFRAGEAQVIYFGDTKQADDLKQLGYTVISKMNYLTALTPDSANPSSILANAKVREALEYAIDRNKMADSLGYGLWRGANQICLPEYPNGFNADITGRNYDPAKAKQLLAEAGYPNGFKTRIIIDQGLNAMESMTSVQSYLKAVGVDAVLENIPRAKYEEYRTTGWNDGLIYVNMGLDTVYLNTLERFLSPSAKVYVSTQRPEGFAKMFSDTRSAVDPDAQTALTRGIVKTMYNLSTNLPLWGTASPCIVDKTLHDSGLVTGRYHFHLWTPEKAWLSK